ncbi:MAG TPA: hypothetical protein VK507_09515, partial [Iamia sp.]|nr:hypothetical protein [Iamia sp.]
MTPTDLPFVAVAPDPSDADVDRAWRRVDQTVRRRRARRRAAAGAGALAAVLLVAGIAGAALRDSPDETVRTDTTSTTTTTVPTLAVEANTTWPEGTLSEDGMTLAVAVGTKPAGTGPCEETFVHDVVETADSVTVGFERTS